ncbi:MAG: hypothetical protein ACRDSZ_02425 [Pseudonocardiaceae bacterium]
MATSHRITVASALPVARMLLLDQADRVLRQSDGSVAFPAVVLARHKLRSGMAV